MFPVRNLSFFIPKTRPQFIFHVGPLKSIQVFTMTVGYKKEIYAQYLEKLLKLAMPAKYYETIQLQTRGLHRRFRRFNQYILATRKLI
jgi:hypothetical protein